MTNSEHSAYNNTLLASREISLEELKNLKQTETRKTYYILKRNNRLFLTYNIALVRPYLTSETHLCTNCRRCRALPFSQKGCEKVYQLEEKYIEDFPFIKLGVQALRYNSSLNNCTSKFLHVKQCSWFEPDPIRTNTGSVYHDKSDQKSRPYYVVSRLNPTHTVTR